MTRFVTDASGRRVWIDDDAPVPAAEAPAEPASLAPPMADPGWVELFLSPNEHGLPLYSPPNSNRRAGRKSRRRI